MARSTTMITNHPVSPIKDSRLKKLDPVGYLKLGGLGRDIQQKTVNAKRKYDMRFEFDRELKALNHIIEHTGGVCLHTIK